jgi:ATP-dependent exoDNAse (exonuclease V) alpha subunit
VIVAPTAIPPESLLKASGLVAASDRFENDYDKEVYNGCRVARIDIEARSPTPNSMAAKLALAYATTIHKSQGSEYPAVVIPPGA